MVEETPTAATTTNENNGCSTKDSSLEDLDEFDIKYGIINSTTPRETQLSGRYKRSFAYYTFRQRLPNTLNTLLNSITGNLKGNNSYAENDVISVLESIGILKNQLENDGPLETLSGNEPDICIWNDFLSGLAQNERSFFKTCWLYSECYMYRKIYSIFEASNNLKNYDYFGTQKLNALQVSSDVMDRIIRNFKMSTNNEETFTHFLKLTLWGNRCDLSISSGKEVKPEGFIFDRIDSFNANILIDDSARIWQCLNKPLKQNDQTRKAVDVVCDNAGFELFTDLLLARYLIEHKLADTVRFHVKAMPWYVSDTTVQDIKCSLRYLQAHQSENLIEFGKQCSKYFEQGVFEVIDKEYFWTTPYEYFRMIEINRTLFQQLQSSALIIFKGDLNYRKLLGDFNWDFTDSFQKCLNGFNPASLCSLRTVKGDLICGLQPGIADQLTSQNPDWMFTGEYGVIQFSDQC